MTLADAVRNTLRRLHYSPRTEESYLRWIRAYVAFHGRRHPRELGSEHVVEFLNDLAVRRSVSASTQNQALCALVFLYRKVLELGPVPKVEARAWRSRSPRRRRSCAASSRIGWRSVAPA